MYLVKDNEHIVWDPPCELAVKIIFKDNMCPYSECENCKECVKNDDDLYMIKVLSETKRLWEA